MALSQDYWLANVRGAGIASVGDAVVVKAP